MTTVHVPILVQPILDCLLEPFRRLPAAAEPHWLVDCTFGGGGHTGAFLEALAGDPSLRRHRVLAFDQDLGAIERGRARFERELDSGRLTLHHARFSEAGRYLAGRPVLGLLADLGFSSDQLGDPERGLSFLSEGPLDMRLDTSRGLSAREFLAETSEAELVEVLEELGEERFSRRIAGAIHQKKRQGILPATTRELAELVIHAIPPAARHGRIHAATRTFQALRIAINDELGELDALLGAVIPAVERGGRVAILSFHSLEDRKVKQALKPRGTREDRAQALFEAITKKPIEADVEEVTRNSRARSAKLRLGERK